MSPLKGTSKSLRTLASALVAMSHRVGRDVVGTLLKSLGYSLQGNRKRLEGSSHADRDAQLQHIAETVAAALATDQPTISVDTKKKELVGAFKNGGREYRPAGSPEPVRVHDFIDKTLGRAAPMGFMISPTIQAGSADAPMLTITAEGGGSNGSRVRLWKVEFQKFAEETGLAIVVLHLSPPQASPPASQAWPQACSARHQQMSKIEHRLFSFISRNWRGRPLVDYRTIVELIGATTSKKSLSVRCERDEARYPAGIKISDDEMAILNIERHDFHGEWNYTIKPREQK